MHIGLRSIRLSVLAALVFVSLGLQQITLAQTPASKVTVHLDPQKSAIHWTLDGNFHTVHGTFQLKGGAMTFDPATGAAEGEFLVDVATGQSDNKARDGKMQREVLESKTFPEAFFHPVKVSGALKPDGTQNVTVEGTFNVHGKDHPLTLQMQVKMNGTEATATTRFTIPYVAWGMKDESTLIFRVAKDVDVDITAQGTVDGLR